MKFWASFLLVFDVCASAGEGRVGGFVVDDHA